MDRNILSMREVNAPLRQDVSRLPRLPSGSPQPASFCESGDRARVYSIAIVACARRKGLRRQGGRVGRVRDRALDPFLTSGGRPPKDFATAELTKRARDWDAERVWVAQAWQASKRCYAERGRRRKRVHTVASLGFGLVSMP